MEKTVKIKDREYIIKEIPYIIAADLDQNNKKDTILKIFKASVGLTDEEINKLTIKEGQILEKAIVEVNELEINFQSPIEKKE